MRRHLFPLLAVIAALLTDAHASAVEVERVVSDSGIEAWLVEEHTNPIISMSVGFRAGSRLDPEGREGTARMMAALLDEGAADLDSQAFQARVENLSTSMSFQAGPDRVAASLQTLTRNRDEAFRLFHIALTEPRFDEPAVARVRGQIQSLLRRRAARPGSIARDSWFRARFPEHPYGRPIWGRPDSIQAITIENLRTYHRMYLTRENLVIGVVGDITPEQLGPLLDRTFGDLPAQTGDASGDRIEPRLSGEVSVIRRPFPQSVVMFGQEGVARKDPDFYAAFVLNHILGGSAFNSRLYEEVREKRGLAYSVNTFLDPLDQSALYLGSVATRNDRVKETIDIIRAEWRRMATEGVTTEELEAAKQYLTGSFPLSFASSENIADFMTSLQHQGLPINYFDIRNELILDVSQDDINRVARELLKPGQLTFVVVGDPQGL